jgi:hypothetical protein
MSDAPTIQTLADAQAAYKRTRGLFWSDNNPGTIEGARTLEAVCVWATREHKECGALKLNALRVLGRYLANTPRLKGRPKKVSNADSLPSLADLGVSDRHVAADALKVHAVPERVFAECMKDTEEPSFRGLMRAAKDDRDSAAIDAMAAEIAAEIAAKEKVEAAKSKVEPKAEPLKASGERPLGPAPPTSDTNRPLKDPKTKASKAESVLAMVFDPAPNAHQREVAAKNLLKQDPDIVERVRQLWAGGGTGETAATGTGSGIEARLRIHIEGLEKRLEIYTNSYRPTAALRREIEARDKIITEQKRTIRDLRKELAAARAEIITLKGRRAAA